MNILAREDRVQDTVRLSIIVVNKNKALARCFTDHRCGAHDPCCTQT